MSPEAARGTGETVLALIRAAAVRYGVDLADRALALFASCVQTQMRLGDQAGRLDGERVGVLMVRIGRRLWARSNGNRARRRGRRGVEIAFYRRFESLMARQGLVRAPAQTQHEFAAAAGMRLASQTGESRLAALPAVVADAFYRVRFGRTPLDNLQTQAVEQALVEIAAIRKNTASGNPRPPGAGA